MRAALDSEYAPPEDELSSDFKSAMMSDYERKGPKRPTNLLPIIREVNESERRRAAPNNDDLGFEYGVDTDDAMERALNSDYDPQRRSIPQRQGLHQRQDSHQRQGVPQREDHLQRQAVTKPLSQSTPPRVARPAAQNNLSMISSDSMRDRDVPVLLSSVYDGSDNDAAPYMYVPRDQASPLNKNEGHPQQRDYNYPPQDDVELGPGEQDEYYRNEGYEDGDGDADDDRSNENDENDGSAEEEDGDNYRRYSDSDSNAHKKRRLDAQELEKPIIYEVPVEDFPTIAWNDGFSGEVANIEQDLELTESESDYASDDSVMEIIDDSDSDSDFETAQADNEYKPSSSGPGLDDGSSSSDSDSDEPKSFQDDDDEDADFEGSEAELSDDDVPMLGSVAEIRKGRPRRARIPTLREYLGERIEYKALGKRELLTAVDVRMVEEPERLPRRRARRRRVQQTSAGSAVGEVGGGFEQSNQNAEDINVNVYDSARRAFRDRTVAKSLNGNDFVQYYNKEDEAVPHVFQQLLFGSERSPLRCFVLRIEPSGTYHSPAEDNKASTFVVWQGTCDVNLNSTEFGLSKGRACIAPRSNDLFINNNSESDVFLFMCEVNNAELADMLPRDAQSMVSMFHAPTSDEDEDGSRTHDYSGGDGLSYDAGPNVEYDSGNNDSGAGKRASDSKASSESGISSNAEISDNMRRMLDSTADVNDPDVQQGAPQSDLELTAPSMEPYMDSNVPNTKVLRETSPRYDYNSTDDSLAAALLDDDKTPENLTPTEQIVQRIALKVGERRSALLRERLVGNTTPENVNKNRVGFLQSPRNNIRNAPITQQTPRASQDVPLGSASHRAVPSPFLDSSPFRKQDEFIRSPSRPAVGLSPIRGVSSLRSPLREPPIQLFPNAAPRRSSLEEVQLAREPSDTIDLDNVTEEHQLDLSVMRPTIPERNPRDMLDALRDLF